MALKLNLTEGNFNANTLQAILEELESRISGSGASAAADGTTTNIIVQGGTSSSNPSVTNAAITWAGGVPTVVVASYSDSTQKTFNITWTGGVPTQVTDGTTIWTITWAGGVPTVVAVT